MGGPGVDEPSTDHSGLSARRQEYERPQGAGVEGDQADGGGRQDRDRGQVRLSGSRASSVLERGGDGAGPEEKAGGAGADVNGEKGGAQHGEYLPLWMIGWTGA